MAEEGGVELNLSPQSANSRKRESFTGIYLLDYKSLIQDDFLAKFLCMKKQQENLLAIYQMPEAVIGRCSVKKVFLEILQNSQENTCAIVSFLIKLQV